MRPRFPPELIAALGGLALTGFASPWVAMSLIEMVALAPSPPQGAPAGFVMASLLMAIDNITTRGAVEYLLNDGVSVVGLVIGIYWLRGGLWPIQWATKRAVPYG